MKLWKLLIRLSLVLIIVTLSCKKDRKFEGNYNGETVSRYTNDSLEVQRLDSTESVLRIAGQKLLEVHELSSLLWRSNDSLEQNLLVSQLRNYFEETDSITLKWLLNEMDSLDAFYVEVKRLEAVPKDSTATDTLGALNYEVHYYSKNKDHFFTDNRRATYVIKSNPEKFRKQFKFYFKTLVTPEEALDSIQSDEDTTVVENSANQE